MALALSTIRTEVRALVRINQGDDTTINRFIYMALDDILREIWGSAPGQYLHKGFGTFAAGAYSKVWDPSAFGNIMGVPTHLYLVSQVGGNVYKPEWVPWKRFQEEKLYEILTMGVTGRPMYWTAEQTEDVPATPDVSFQVQIFPKADVIYNAVFGMKWQPYGGDNLGLKLDLFDHLLVIGGSYYASRMYRSDLASLWRTRFSTALREFSSAVAPHTGLRKLGGAGRPRAPRTQRGPWIPDWV